MDHNFYFSFFLLKESNSWLHTKNLNTVCQSIVQTFLQLQASCKLALNSFRDGKPTTSPGSLCQGLAAFWVSWATSALLMSVAEIFVAFSSCQQRFKRGLLQGHYGQDRHQLPLYPKDCLSLQARNLGEYSPCQVHWYLYQEVIIKVS